MTDPKTRFKRLGSDGVLTHLYADASWCSISAPMNHWLPLSHEIQREARSGDPAPRGTINSTLHEDHDVTVSEHGLGIDLNQEGRIVHIDHSQFDRLIEILRRQERDAA